MNDTEFNDIFPVDTPRQFQRETVEQIVEAYESGIKHIVINAPTGIGKSVIAMAVSNHLGSSYILTSQKMLQAQYADDFRIPQIKGKYNYHCNKNPELKCDFGECVKTKQEYKCNDCEYLCARNRAYKADICVLNYTYFFNMAREASYIQKPRKLLVLDECHNAERELLEYATITLDKDDFLKFKLGKAFLSFPNEKKSKDYKYDWLFGDVRDCLTETYEHELTMFEAMEEHDKLFYEQTRKCKYLDTQICTINRLEEEYTKTKVGVVIHNEHKAVAFKLVFGRTFTNEYLFNFAEHSLSMSATVLSKEQYCSNMGIKENDTLYIQCPSVFPIENRKVYATYAGSMSFKNKTDTLPKIGKIVEELLELHKHERGIIHTVNYSVAEYLIEYLQDDRLIFPRGKERDSMIKLYMQSSRKDYVLISPSLQEGIDLKDDLSRFTIICKMPFANIADEWVKTRMQLDPIWYTENTVANLIQMTGRSVRSETDHASAYILDKDFEWFFKYNHNRFPDWWSESVYSK